MITCRKVTKIPVTDVVIKSMEVMAHNQGFKDLKFKNRHGVIFHDADWLAGVDYEDEDENKREEYADKDEEYEDSVCVNHLLWVNTLANHRIPIPARGVAHLHLIIITCYLNL